MSSMHNSEGQPSNDQSQSAENGSHLNDVQGSIVSRNSSPDESERLDLALEEESADDVLRFTELSDEENSVDIDGDNEPIIFDVISEKLSIPLDDKKKGTDDNNKEETGESCASEQNEPEKKRLSAGQLNVSRDDKIEDTVDHDQNKSRKIQTSTQLCEGVSSINKKRLSGSQRRKMRRQFAKENMIGCETMDVDNRNVHTSRNEFNASVSERSRFTNQRGQLHHESLERTPFTREKSKSHRETQPRYFDSDKDQFTNNRNKIYMDKRGRSSYTSEISQFSETLEKSSFRGISPFSSKKIKIDHGPDNRNHFTDERSQWHREIRQRSPFFDSERRGVEVFSQSNCMMSGPDTQEANLGNESYHNSFDMNINDVNHREPYYPCDNIATSTRQAEQFDNTNHANIQSRIFDICRNNMDLVPHERTPPDHRSQNKKEIESAKVVQNNLLKKTVIVPVTFPGERFSKFETQVIHSLLLTRMAHCIQKGTVGLDIVNAKYQRGGFIVTTKDPFTRKWLEDLVPQLKGRKGGNLRIGSLNELIPKIKAIMWLPNKLHGKQPYDLIKQLEKENPGLPTKHWRITSLRKKIMHAKCLALEIHEKDIRNLKKFNMTPKLYNERVTFKLLIGKKTLLKM